MVNITAPYKDPVAIKRLIQFLDMHIDTKNFTKKYEDSPTDNYSQYLQWVLDNSTQKQLQQTLNFQQFSKTIPIAKIVNYDNLKEAL